MNHSLKHKIDRYNYKFFGVQRDQFELQQDLTQLISNHGRQPAFLPRAAKNYEYHGQELNQNIYGTLMVK